jgi:hypothetical protein
MFPNGAFREDPTLFLYMVFVVFCDEVVIFLNNVMLLPVGCMIVSVTFLIDIPAHALSLIFTVMNVIGERNATQYTCT